MIARPKSSVGTRGRTAPRPRATVVLQGRGGLVLGEVVGPFAMKWKLARTPLPAAVVGRAATSGRLQVRGDTVTAITTQARAGSSCSPGVEAEDETCGRGSLRSSEVMRNPEMTKKTCRVARRAPRRPRMRRCRPRCSGCVSGFAFQGLPPSSRVPRAMRSSWARRASTRSNSNERFGARSGQNRRSPARSCTTRCPCGGVHRTPVSKMSSHCVRSRSGWRSTISKRSRHTPKRCWHAASRTLPSPSWKRSCWTTRCAPTHTRP